MDREIPSNIVCRDVSGKHDGEGRRSGDMGTMSRAPVDEDPDAFLSATKTSLGDGISGDSSSEEPVPGGLAFGDTTAGEAAQRMEPPREGRDLPRDPGVPAAARYSRRLSDKILIAFHHACDQTDFDIAAQLLQILETMLMRRPITADSNRRRSMESLVAAYERLWHLRHPSDEQF